MIGGESESGTGDDIVKAGRASVAEAGNAEACLGKAGTSAGSSCGRHTCNTFELSTAA